MTTIAIAQQDGQLTDEQIDLVKRTICQDATDDELQLFLHACSRMRLDPFAKQVYAIKRRDNAKGRDVMSIQVSIDGYRLVAARTGQYEGQTEAQWCGNDGRWVNVWLKPDPPVAARVGVFRTGFREPCYAVARYAAYVQTRYDQQSGRHVPNHFWKRFPDSMLAKVAETLALRKAFPAELSGTLGEDEMGQADSDRATDRHVAQPSAQMDRLAAATRPPDEPPAGVDPDVHERLRELEPPREEIEDACSEYDEHTGEVAGGVSGSPRRPDGDEYGFVHFGKYSDPAVHLGRKLRQIMATEDGRTWMRWLLENKPEARSEMDRRLRVWGKYFLDLHALSKHGDPADERP